MTDAAQLGEEPPLEVARKLLRVGVKTALITLAGEGCLALRGSEVVRVHAPQVEAVDGCGAGATFSAGFIYGHLHGLAAGGHPAICHCRGVSESHPRRT